MLPSRGGSRMSGLQWTILGLLFLSTVVNYVDRQTTSVLKTTLCDALQLTNSDYGSITSAFMFSYAIAGLVMGIWVDRVGVRWGLGMAVLAWSLLAMGHAAAQGVWSLIVLRVLMAFGEGANWPAGGKAIARWLPPDRSALAMGIFDGGSALGAVVAPPLISVLAIHTGWRGAFIGTGLLGIVWLAAWFWVYYDPTRHPRLSPDERAAYASRQRSESSKRTGFWIATGFLLRQRAMWGLIVVRLLATPVWWFYVFWLPAYLTDYLKFGLKELGLFGWIPYLTTDVGKVVGGIVSDRMLRMGISPSVARKSVMFSGAVCMSAGALIPAFPTPATTLLLASIVTLGWGFWSCNTLALHSDSFPSHLMGTAIGLTGMLAAMTSGVSSKIVGVMVDKYGYTSPFVAAGFLPLLAFLVLVFGVGRVRMAEDTTTDGA